MRKRARQIVKSRPMKCRKVEKNWLFELLSVANNQFRGFMQVTEEKRRLVHGRMIGAIE